MENNQRNYGIIHLASPLLIWAGMVIAITMEAIMKFKAPSLSLAVGLDVGRQVFPALMFAEWILLGVTLIIFFAQFPRFREARVIIPLSLAIICLALQFFYFLPILMHQAAEIIAGNAPPPSGAHKWFGVTTVVKVIMLLATANFALRSK